MKKDTHINLPIDLKRAAIKAAEKQGLNLTTYIILALNEKLKKEKGNEF